MPNTNSQHILVIGDWIFDEYWLLHKERTTIAAHTGFQHYKLAQQPGEPMGALCGAGHITRVLSAGIAKNRHVHITGMGCWHEDDTELLEDMLSGDAAKCEINSVRRSLSWSLKNCEKPSNVELRPIPCKSVDESTRFTEHAIRQFYQEEGELVQASRVDCRYQQPPPDITELKKEFASAIKAHGKVDFVVILDFLKGAITNEVVQALKGCFPDTTWFIRSKERVPGWFRSLPKGAVNLAVFGPEVAGAISPWESWLIGRDSSHPTRAALEVLSAAKEWATNAILFTDRWEAIAVLGTLNGNQRRCVAVKGYLGKTPLDQLGWTSSIMACLILNYVHDAKLTGETLAKAMDEAREYTGIKVPESFELHDEQPQRAAVAVHDEDWASEWEKWEEAMKFPGTVLVDQEKDKHVIQVWRAFPGLPNYVSCRQEIQEKLNLLGRELRSFAHGEYGTRSLTAIIRAEPAAGKTHLARALAEAFDFSFLHFNISQFSSIEGMMKLFDDVAASQASSVRDHRLMVFVDEIDALIGTTPVYSSFLGPLEEGWYIREGKRFHLRPCVMLFAGGPRHTQPDSKLRRQDHERQEKLSDFESRMIVEIDLDQQNDDQKKGEESNKAEKEARKLERSYLGTLLVKRYFPDVNYISRKVLLAFGEVGDKNSARRLRSLCCRLTNVRDGTVSAKNCKRWEEEPRVDTESEDDSKLIRIEL